MVYEDLSEEVSKGQKEGKEREVIEAVEEQKKSRLSYHSTGMNMAEWKKKANLHAAPSALTDSTEGTLSLTC